MSDVETGINFGNKEAIGERLILTILEELGFNVSELNIKVNGTMTLESPETTITTGITDITVDNLAITNGVGDELIDLMVQLAQAVAEEDTDLAAEVQKKLEGFKA